MKSIFLAIALILSVQYSRASIYIPVSSQVFSKSILYQDLFELGFDYTLQKATFGGSKNSLNSSDWYNSSQTVAKKIQNGVTYLKCNVIATDVYGKTFKQRSHL